MLATEPTAISISSSAAETFPRRCASLRNSATSTRSDGHRLIWLKDIERSIAVEQSDLDELTSRCHIYKCSAPVGLILERSRTLLDAEIPGDVIEMLTPASQRALNRYVSAFVHPVQLHERQTATRVFTRSMRSSAVASFAALPKRAARRDPASRKRSPNRRKGPRLCRSIRTREVDARGRLRDSPAKAGAVHRRPTARGRHPHNRRRPARVRTRCCTAGTVAARGDRHPDTLPYCDRGQGRAPCA